MEKCFSETDSLIDPIRSYSNPISSTRKITLLQTRLPCKRTCGVRWLPRNLFISLWFPVYWPNVPRFPCLENVILLCEMTVCGWFPRSSPRLQSQFKRFCHSDLCFVHSIRFLSNIPIRGITFFPHRPCPPRDRCLLPSLHDCPLSLRSSPFLSFFFFRSFESLLRRCVPWRR